MTEKLNWVHVQELMMDMVSDIMSEEVEYVETQATLKLPKQMIEMLEYIAVNTGDSTAEVLTEYASSGIMTQLQELIAESLSQVGLEDLLSKGSKEVPNNSKEVPQIDIKNLMKEAGVDISALESTLDQLQNLAKQLDPDFKIEE